MNFSDDEEDIFDFTQAGKANENEYAVDSNSQVDYNFIKLRDSINNFNDNLSTLQTFDHYQTWNVCFAREPIKLNSEPIDNVSGVFDLIKSDNIFINKVISVFCILHSEIFNIFKHDPYELLSPLIVYGETLEEDDKIEDGEAENQIAKMLPYLMELVDKVMRLLSISVNLLNQLGAFYNKSSKNFNESFKFVTLLKPFEYLGMILSFFLAIDSVVEENSNLTSHWKSYRYMFSKCKNDCGKFGFTEDQGKRLARNLRKIEGSILSGKLYFTCLKHIGESTGEFKDVLIPLEKNKEFVGGLFTFLKYRFEKLNSAIGSMTETNEKVLIFQYLAVFGYYNILVKAEADKKLFKAVWGLQKDVTNITFYGHNVFNIEKFLRSVHQWGDKFVYDPKKCKSTK